MTTTHSRGVLVDLAAVAVANAVADCSNRLIAKDVAQTLQQQIQNSGRLQIFQQQQRLCLLCPRLCITES